MDEKQTHADNWSYRFSGMICKTCIFFVEKKNIKEKILGRCRRNAPTMSGFPVVFETDWCGNHKIDENKM